MEIKIHNYIRWNAMAMVVRANKDTNVGGHIASFASAATLYDVGFNALLARAVRAARRRPDLLPGPLGARASMPAPSCSGRLTEEQMDNFRQEVDGKGISSYPHPWLMPDFWQFPTVSMGLGPDPGDLPGALHEVHGQPRLIRSAGSARSGPSSATARPTRSSRSGAIGMAGARSSTT
jgi:pyruvate dehydrogenase E1 component